MRKRGGVWVKRLKKKRKRGESRIHEEGTGPLNPRSEYNRRRKRGTGIRPFGEKGGKGTLNIVRKSYLSG